MFTIPDESVESIFNVKFGSIGIIHLSAL